MSSACMAGPTNSLLTRAELLATAVNKSPQSRVLVVSSCVSSTTDGSRRKERALEGLPREARPVCDAHACPVRARRPAI
jgi:hypothetical protein